jgi:hypothetical protein
VILVNKDAILAVSFLTKEIRPRDVVFASLIVLIDSFTSTNRKANSIPCEMKGSMRRPVGYPGLPLKRNVVSGVVGRHSPRSPLRMPKMEVW